MKVKVRGLVRLGGVGKIKIFEIDINSESPAVDQIDEVIGNWAMDSISWDWYPLDKQSENIKERGYG